MVTWLWGPSPGLCRPGLERRERGAHFAALFLSSGTCGEGSVRTRGHGIATGSSGWTVRPQDDRFADTTWYFEALTIFPRFYFCQYCGHPLVVVPEKHRPPHSLPPGTTSTTWMRRIPASRSLAPSSTRPRSSVAWSTCTRGPSSTETSSLRTCSWTTTVGRLLSPGLPSHLSPSPTCLYGSMGHL